MRLIFLLFVSILFLSSLAKAQDPKDLATLADDDEPIVFLNSATIQVLNKITAKAEKISLQAKKPLIINNIEIILHKCWQAPSYQRPETKILLEVLQNDNNQNKKTIFHGWLFASSPSLSSLEHPIYDIVALNCSKSK
jgi:hypothetical protein